LSIAYFGSIAIATLISNFYLGTSKVFERFNHSVLNPMYNKLSINFAAHRSLINILNVVTANFDKVLLFQTLGAHQTASYIIAISLPNRIKALIKQFEPYVFAKFANHSAEAVRSKLQSKFFFGLLISIPFFVLYVASAPFVFKVLLPQYENIALLSTIYAVSIFSGISFIPYAVLQAHAGEKEFYVYTVISSVIQIVFLLIGAHVALLSGAIIGKMLSSLVNTVIVFLMALRIGTSTNSSHTIISSPEIPS
jgi:O-antigen/teichoic acid export membrane protein